MRIVLLGNPNSGKSTLFNALTGAHQLVGNWPGVTVEAVIGHIQATDGTHELVDLPGVYALDCLDEQSSPDERITLAALNSGQVGCIINIVDACHLERHAYLTSQLLELGIPMVLVLTMMDRCEKQGIVIHQADLAAQTGCPVVSVHAVKGIGLDALLTTLPSSVTPLDLPRPLQLDISDSEPSTIPEDIHLADARYAAVHQLVNAVQTKSADARDYWTDVIDRVLLHRVFAIPLFFCIMYVFFFVAIQGGGVLQGYLNQWTEMVLIQYPTHCLEAMQAPFWLIAWGVNGVARGLSTTLTFIPVMGCMFFFLSMLEASGYMVRAAFVADRAMRYLGLPGKAFVPMLIGFGCNVPGVLATRTLESERERLLAIFMMPFMSCSARLTIYAVFVAAFFPHGGHNVVFLLYLIGIMMAIVTGIILRRTVYTGSISPLILELPVYQLPSLGRLCKDTLLRLRLFLWRAGRLIIVVSTLLSCLSGFAMLTYLGQHIVWLFAPMGIRPDNWPAAVGLITGAFAKEVVIGTLASLYTNLGNSDNGLAGMSAYFEGQVGAYAYLLFVLLYIPCVSTMAAIRQEASRRVMWFSILWSSVLAYTTAVIFYQLATLARHPLQSVLTVLASVGLMGGVIAMLTWRTRRAARRSYVVAAA